MSGKKNAEEPFVIKSTFSSQIEEKERLRILALMIVGTLLYPLWGTLLRPYVSPDYWDPDWMRYTVTILIPSGWFISQWNGKNTERLKLAVVVITWILTIHAAALMIVNPHNFHGVLGMIIVMATLSSVIHSTKALYWYAGLCLAICAANIAWGRPDWAGGITFTTIGILSAVLTGVMSHIYSVAIFEKLKESETQRENILSTMTEGIVVQDLNNKILSYNDAALKILGLSSEQLLGQNSHDPGWRAITEDGLDFKVETHPAVLVAKSGIPKRNVTMGVQRPDQEIVWISINTVPLFPDGAESWSGTLTTFQDITEMKKAQQTTQENQAQMAHRSKLSSLGEMASGLAHEINNPLAIISGRFEQLKIITKREPVDHEQVNTIIDKGIAGVFRIQKIIKGLKSISRDSGDDPFEPVALTEIIKDSLEICQEKIRRDQVEIKIEVPEDLQIHCRAGQISQILINLVGNSIDAMEKMTERKIEFKSAIVGDQIQIYVTDSGPGIPAEIQAKMMQPFFTTKEVGKGTGLGLSISHGIMKQHGGLLRLDNSQKNTTFVLEFPKNGPQSTHQAA